MTILRTAPANQLGWDVQTLALEPTMRPATAGFGASLACALAATLFILDTDVTGAWWLPLSFLGVAVVFGVLRQRPLPPPADPRRIAAARAVLGVLQSERVTLDLDLGRDPWLRLSAGDRTIEVSGDSPPTLSPPDPELQTALEAALATAEAA